MAETGLSLVVSKEMLANLQKADNMITNLATKSEQAKNRIVAAFTEMGQKGVGAFINKLHEAQSKIASLNSVKVQGIDFTQFTNSTTQAIDSVNKLTEAVGKVSKGSIAKPSEASNKTVFSRINEEVPQVIKNIHSVETAMGKILVGDKTYSNSALTKINAEIDTAMKKLGEVNKMLQFYAKGEGKKAIGFADTTSYQKEAKELMNIIDLLQRQRQSIIANAQLRMKVAQQQEAEANRYVAMENERRERIQANAKLESDLARKRTNDAKKNYEEQYKAYERMFDEIERRERKLAQQQAKNDSRMRKKDYERYVSTQDTYSHAMNVSNRAKTLNQELRAIKALEQARGNLNKTDSQYEAKLLRLNAAIRQHKQNIDRATQSSKSLQSSHRGLMNISEQLQRRLALVFSVSQITGYVNKLISVRGEFELQQRSLQAILQDRDEANKLWQQTVDLAVRSPFRVKELVTYTKQLAAYRIETEKLHDTTKMLSDVAAGLGVDMQRLILAFGQVKAANYLRGTELRQFSEAGINILGELATYFTELEGVAVSVGEVFERVSKRMVTFGDVEEVFKRLTSAGGTFYRMQEIQSNTLRGMISNLKDSIDLMLNDIGQSNDGVLKTMVNVSKGVVENWQVLANMLKLVVTGFAMYKVNALLASKAVKDFALSVGVFTNTTLPKQLTMLQLLNVGWAKFTVSAKAAGVALKTFIASNIWVLAITALAAAIYELVTWNKELNEQLGELNNRRDEELSQINNLTRAYQQLNKEQQKEGANSNAIFSEKLKKLKELQNLMGDARLSIPITSEPITQENIDDIFRETENLLRFARDWGYDLGKEIAKGMSSAEGWFDIFGENLLSDLKDLDDATSKVTGAMTYGLDKVVRSLQASYPNLTKDAQDYLEVIEKGRRNDETEEAWLERKVKLLQNIYKSYRVDKPEELKDIEQELLHITTQRKEVAYELDKVISNFTKAYGVTDFSHLSQEQKVLLKTEIDKAFEQQQLSDQTKRFAAHYMANKLKIPVEFVTPEDTGNGLLDWQTRYNAFIDGLTTKSLSAIRDVTQTREALRKTIKEQVEQQQDIIDAYNVKGQEAYSTKEMEEAEKKIKDLTKAYVWLGGAIDTLNKKSAKDEQVKILNNRIKLVKDIHEEYKKLNKTFDETTSKEKVFESFSDTFKQAFQGTGINLSGLLIDNDKLNQLKEEGEKSGQVFSESMLQKMNEVISSGTYIRNASDVFKEVLRQDEGVRYELYDDKTGKVIRNAQDFANKVGTATIGIGHAVFELSEATKYFGRTLSDVDVQKLFDADIAKHEEALNRVLDDYNELILTQEQYDALLNKTYQGGSGAIRSALEYATNVEEGLKHFEKLDTKLKAIGATFDVTFGHDFIDKFKNAQTVVERLALVLQTINLTTKASGGNIDKELIGGMLKRSKEVAAQFSGDLNLVKLLEKASINISQIDFTNIEGVIATLKKLEPLAKKEGKDAMLALSKAISELETQVGIDVKIKEDKALLDQIEEMFSGYEISLELQKLNIPNDLAEQLFNVDTFTLPELKDAIIKLKPEFEGKDMLDEWNKLMKRIDDIEVKATRERLKTYTKYLVKAQSERVKIKLEEMRQLEEVEKENAYTPEQKSVIKQAIRDETQSKIDKQIWEDFKNTTLYIQMFDELEYVSTNALKKMQTELLNMRDSLKNLEPSELKEIQDRLAAIGDEIIERNPFEELSTSLKDGIKAIKTLDAQQEKFNKAQANEDKAKELVDTLQLQVEETKKRNAEFKASGAFNKATEAFLDSQLKTQEEQLEVAIEEYAVAKGITTEEAKQLLLQQQTISEANKKLNNVGKIGSEIIGMAGEISDMLGNWGIDLGEGFTEALSGFGQAFDALSSIDLLKPMSIIKGVVGVFAGIGNAIAGIFGGNKDAKREREIRREVELIENLEKSYEKLEKAIKNAYDVDTLKKSYAAANNNINQQIVARERAIKLEEDKKKTDNNRIKEWQQEIEDLRQQREQLLKDQVENLGGGYDFASATEEFVNAWLDAFKETGNGLSGLEENFADFWQNVAIKQAVMGGASKILEPFLNEVNKALENDFTISDSEMASIDALGEDAKAKLDAFLQQWYSRWGDMIGDTEQGELSGLQRGIQELSESTGQELAAYLNSIRFFVADTNTKLSQFVDAFFNTDSVNPILSQLRIIAQQTTAIHTLLDSLTTPHPTLSGRGLKVVL